MQTPKRDDLILADVRDHVAYVTLNRPHTNHSFNDPMRIALLRAVEDAAANEAAQVIVLSSTGEEAFSAGNDLEEVASMTAIEAEAAARRNLSLHRRLTQIDKPVIAAIKGACLGAGFELALHCDIRLGRADVRFGFPGVNVGLTSSGSALARLQRISGQGAAAALALTGGMVTAERAFMLGIISNVAPVKEFSSAVEQLAAHLKSLSPLCLAEMKRLLRLAAEQGLEAAAEQGPKSLAACYSQDGAADRLRVLFGGPGPSATLH
jgi:enoyl-CoA hydratase